MQAVLEPAKVEAKRKALIGLLFLVPGRKLFVVGTTSLKAVLEEMDVTSAFNFELNVPKLSESEIRTVLASQKAFDPLEVSHALP